MSALDVLRAYDRQHGEPEDFGEAIDAVAALIEASARTIRAFEAYGKTSDVTAALIAHRECESAMVAQKDAIAKATQP